MVRVPIAHHRTLVPHVLPHVRVLVLLNIREVGWLRKSANHVGIDVIILLMLDRRGYVPGWQLATVGIVHALGYFVDAHWHSGQTVPLKRRISSIRRLVHRHWQDPGDADLLLILVVLDLAESLPVLPLKLVAVEGMLPELVQRLLTVDVWVLLCQGRGALNIVRGGVAGELIFQVVGVELS